MWSITCHLLYSGATKAMVKKKGGSDGMYSLGHPPCLGHMSPIFQPRHARLYGST